MSEPNEISNHSGPASAAEPSMEEILASIRRILKEDESEEDDDELLVLTPSMVTPPADISTATALPEVAADGGGPVNDAPPFTSPPTMDYGTGYHDEGGPQPRPRPGARTQTIQNDESYGAMSPAARPSGIVGETAASMVANTIGSLVRNISSERAASISRGGPTIEDIVREEIKPILKGWLDTHLPILVERIVRAEIERLVDRTQI
jgi:cell pole-organizing protein PopZ